MSMPYLKSILTMEMRKLQLETVKDKAIRVILYQGMSDGGELFKILVNVFANSFTASLSICAAFLGQKVGTAVWHKQLGHPSEEVLTSMLKSADIPVNKDSCQIVCSSCIKGTMCRQVFPVRCNKASFLFEKVHSHI